MGLEDYLKSININTKSNAPDKLEDGLYEIAFSKVKLINKNNKYLLLLEFIILTPGKYQNRKFARFLNLTKPDDQSGTLKYLHIAQKVLESLGIPKNTYDWDDNIVNVIIEHVNGKTFNVKVDTPGEYPNYTFSTT